MPSSPISTSILPSKRPRNPPHRSKPRKKHKKLDAIRDSPAASYLPHRDPAAGAGESSVLRRSSRARRAPDMLDSSPVVSPRRKKHKDLDAYNDKDEVNKGKLKGKEKEVRVLFPVMIEENVGVRTSIRSSRRRKKASDVAIEVGEKDDTHDSQVDVDAPPLGGDRAAILESAEQVAGVVEEAECVNANVEDGGEDAIPVSEDFESNQSGKFFESFDAVEKKAVLEGNEQMTKQVLD